MSPICGPPRVWLNTRLTERTILLIRDDTADAYVTERVRSVQNIAKPQIPELVSVWAKEPLHVIHIKLEIPEKEKPVIKKILVVVDHFMRYIQAYVTSNETAHTVTTTLYHEYFSVFGFPRKLVSARESASVHSDFCHAIEDRQTLQF